MRRALPYVFLLLTSPLALGAGQPTRFDPADLKIAAELRDLALQDDTAWKFTEDLTTQIGPRLAGSEADLKAREWTIARFHALGFDRVWTEPVRFPKWERRGERGRITAPYPQPLVLTALGHSPGTAAGGLDAEVVGFASLDELEAADPARLAGKIAYVGARMQATQSGRDYGIGSAVRTRGPSIASGKGAVGFLLRSAGTDRERLPHTGVTHFDDGVTPIPAAALSAPDADQMERILASGKPLRVHLELDCGFDGEYEGANVIGELTGSRRPNEYFLMGGHLDSWDLGTGAIDDAAGVAIAAAATHLISRRASRPARSIRVIAFANEESGLYGGRAYAEAHRKDIGKAVLGGESDLGADRIYRMTASVKPEARAALAQMAVLLQPLGIEYDPDAPGSGGSDLSAVHAVGMAGLSLHQDASRYFDWHHSANDTLDKIDPAQLRQNVAAYAVVAWLAAQAQGDFGSAPNAFARQRKD